MVFDLGTRLLLHFASFFALGSPILDLLIRPLRWDNAVETALMIPFTTVVAGNHSLSTFRQTAGAVNLEYFRFFRFLNNLSSACWKMTEDFIFQTSSKVFSHHFWVVVHKLRRLAIAYCHCICNCKEATIRVIMLLL